MSNVLGVDVGFHSILVQYQRFDAPSSSKRHVEGLSLASAAGLQRVRGKAGPDLMSLFASEYKPPSDGGIGQYATDKTDRENGDGAQRCGHEG